MVNEWNLRTIKIKLLCSCKEVNVYVMQQIECMFIKLKIKNSATPEAGFVSVISKIIHSENSI